MTDFDRHTKSINPDPDRYPSIATAPRNSYPNHDFQSPWQWR